MRDKVNFFFLLLIVFQGTQCCLREPSPYHSRFAKEAGDNGFKITINPDLENYEPGKVYTVLLVGPTSYDNVKHFTRFILAVESNNDRNNKSSQKVGGFQLFKDSITKFNEDCINTVSEVNDLLKTEIYVTWTAPPQGSGCVTFRAMVLQDSKHWYADEGQLSRKMCEQTTVDMEYDGTYSKYKGATAAVVTQGRTTNPYLTSLYGYEIFPWVKSYFTKGISKGDSQNNVYINERTEMPTTYAASPHHKQEKQTLHREVNYSQDNYSENLNRNRRQINLNNIFFTNNKHKIGILQKDSSGNRKAGDLYVGTTAGLYLKYVGTHNIKKIQGINEPVYSIHIDFNGGAFVTTSTGKLYYIDQNGHNEQGVQTYIPDPVLSIGVLKKKSSGSRNAGDIYIGTTEGVYLKYVGTHKIKKIKGINEPVTAINIDFNGGAYVTTSLGKLYYIDINGNNNQGLQSYIPDKILSIAVLEKKSTGSRQAGDIYIGTIEGLYLKYVGTHTIKRINGIHEAVASIDIDFNGGAFVTTSTGKLYYIDQNGHNEQGLQNYIPDQILSIGVLRKNSVGARLAGDIYIGTTEGVYLKYVGTHTIKKINGIDEPVTAIFIDFNGGAFLTTSTGKLYYINVNGDNDQGVQSYIPDKIL